MCVYQHAICHSTIDICVFINMPFYNCCTFYLQTCSLKLHRHDLRVPVGSLSRFKLSLPQCNIPGVLNCMSGRLSGFPRSCIDGICVLAMTIIIFDRTQMSIRVQTYARKSRGSLCYLPRKLTKVTPSGVKVNLAEKIIFFILLISPQLIHFYCVALML